MVRCERGPASPVARVKGGRRREAVVACRFPLASFVASTVRTVSASRWKASTPPASHSVQSGRHPGERPQAETVPTADPNNVLWFGDPDGPGCGDDRYRDRPASERAA